ncbi:tRNA-splicing endonuclease subunit Sen2-like [Clytia hemisphaerica]|uniref:tRNA-splicing endonuclease subunit Sen2-like n=1 Tax=Clytia hemisphaerica TaxID=252671 RepID=UPI0034D44BDE
MATAPNYLMTDELLRKPRKKRCGRQVPLSPFPVPIQTITRQQPTNDRWYYFFGLLKSDHVAVYRKGDLTYLYQMGFFGKGILSKSQPQYEKYEEESFLLDHAKRQSRSEGRSKAQLESKQAFLQERLRQHENWSWMKEKKDDIESTRNTLKVTSDNSTELSSTINSVDLRVPDESYGTDGEDELSNEEEDQLSATGCFENEDDGETVDCTLHENEKETLKRKTESQDDWSVGKMAKIEDQYKLFEYLQLTFEEAFFLSYGLGCLCVEDHNQIGMNVGEMWRTFSCRQKDFVQRYTAYHHFRSKGWVVRFSNLFGADFVLYQSGMPFYHASYSVFVRYMDEKDGGLEEKSFSWKDLSCICRVNEKVAKEVLICYVVKPKGKTM